MPLALRAIVPKKAVLVVNPGAAIQRELRSFAVDLVDEMQDYPPPRPWKRPPKSGPRKGGKRTVSLGRNWGFRFEAPNRVLVGNPIKYAGFVQGYKRGAVGERQTRVMAGRGWQSLSDVSKRLWTKHLPGLRRCFRRAA